VDAFFFSFLYLCEGGQEVLCGVNCCSLLNFLRGFQKPTIEGQCCYLRKLCILRNTQQYLLQTGNNQWRTQTIGEQMTSWRNTDRHISYLHGPNTDESVSQKPQLT